MPWLEILEEDKCKFLVFHPRDLGQCILTQAYGIGPQILDLKLSNSHVTRRQQCQFSIGSIGPILIFICLLILFI